ncbi:SCO1664 family protein [Hoyosella altamirensis]|uniref:Putative repeat protein (TIGR03843 family) n=1 Tax=Hoyosella altamirensis TaxID=616997 RepID=A0A839RVM2_9ACTN|nr:SCO1664 family protein [Hoyosella altamirensis]MBB3039821.1 putative repeat protein (TIGR03843 family) [Hoyosella altamirensis]
MTGPLGSSPEPVAVDEVLRDGELTVLGQLRAASNASFLCDASKGATVVRCIYKPIRGERPLWDFPDGTLAARELAAFRISSELGWGIVPTTMVREGPFGLGAVQEWITELDEDTVGQALLGLFPIDALPAGWLPVLRAVTSDDEEVVLAHADDVRLARIAVFDLVVNNADRKGGHVLAGSDGAVYGIDHGISLHREDKLRTVLWGWAGRAISDDHLADLQRLGKAVAGVFGDELRALITDEEVSATVRRIRRILDEPYFPRPVSGLGPVSPIPWPPF